jgi:hypothetical protein
MSKASAIVRNGRGGPAKAMKYKFTRLDLGGHEIGSFAGRTALPCSLQSRRRSITPPLHDLSSRHCTIVDSAAKGLGKNREYSRFPDTVALAVFPLQLAVVALDATKTGPRSSRISREFPGDIYGWEGVVQSVRSWECRVQNGPDDTLLQRNSAYFSVFQHKREKRTCSRFGLGATQSDPVRPK